MLTITLAAPIARYLNTAGERVFVVEATTVRQAIEQMLLQAPGIRGYLLDDQGALRHHIAAFVNDVVVRDKVGLSEAVPPNGEIYIMQALSGG